MTCGLATGGSALLVRDNTSVLVGRCGNTPRMVVKGKETGSRSACVLRRVTEGCRPSANSESFGGWSFDVTFKIYTICSV